MQITQTAQDKIQDILVDEPKGSFVRLCVDSGGCSGFQYRFFVDHHAQEDDIRYGLLVMDTVSSDILKDATIDYKMDLMQECFVVTSPSFERSCGCGQSFDISLS